MRDYVWRASASAETANAAAWYERRRAGLGSEFLAAIDDALARIAERPQAFRVVTPRIRRARLRRFPYGVFFTLREDRVEVLAVHHARRKTRSFRDR